MAIGLWNMSLWDLNVSMWTVIWPGIIVGVGMVLIFPTLSATALSAVPRERVGYAASLYNMMRNTGAAIGISYLTTMLVDKEQIHQSYLVEHLTVFDAWRLSKGSVALPGGRGFDYLPQLISGQKQGIFRLYQMVQGQATMLSFNDIYRMLAIIMLILVPGFILLRRSGGARTAAH